MGKDVKIKKYLHQLEISFSKEMPRIKEEVKIYERNLKEGKLILTPKVSPQFNV